jgi:hypothetical protein
VDNTTTTTKINWAISKILGFKNFDGALKKIDCATFFSKRLRSNNYKPAFFSTLGMSKGFVL